MGVCSWVNWKPLLPRVGRRGGMFFEEPSRPFKGNHHFIGIMQQQNRVLQTRSVQHSGLPNGVAQSENSLRRAKSNVPSPTQPLGIHWIRISSNVGPVFDTAPVERRLEGVPAAGKMARGAYGCQRAQCRPGEEPVHCGGHLQIHSWTQQGDAPKLRCDGSQQGHVG